jgi:asparaginyl-tRNA synthetase
VRTFRNNQFIALNDGSTIDNIQCVVDFENTPDETLRELQLVQQYQLQELG